jgi:anaerobic magnesium-protoporphyrin IX monomethyl ester cyclase
MKIAFVNPPFLKNYSRGQRSPGVTKSGTLYYPYFLALAAGFLQEHGFKVFLFDFVARNFNDSKSLKALQKFSPDLVVIETSTPSIFADFSFASKVKKRLPQTFVLLVGTHVSALPKWSLKKCQDADAVLAGEYEKGILALAKELKKANKTGSEADLKKAGGLVFRNFATISNSKNNKKSSNKRKFLVKDKIVTNPRGDFLHNLDKLPFVSKIYKQFLDVRDYYFAASSWPMLMVIGGRGCPYGCFYCLYPQVMHGLRYRPRSARNLALEFKYIENNLAEVKEVVLEDDTFTVDKKRVRKFCKLLIQQENKLSWSVNARVDLDLKTMEVMKKAGCRLLIVGFESGEQKVLDGMDKKIKVKDSFEFMERAKKANLLVHGCFMVGNPGETRKSMVKTLSFAKKLDPDSAQFYPLFLYPGTRAWNWADKKGYLKTKDFSKWVSKKGYHKTVLNLPNLSSRQMEEFCQKAYLSFHLRPSYILKKLVQFIKDPQEGKRSIRSFFNFLGFKN